MVRQALKESLTTGLSQYEVQKLYPSIISLLLATPETILR